MHTLCVKEWTSLFYIETSLSENTWSAQKSRLPYILTGANKGIVQMASTTWNSSQKHHHSVEKDCCISLFGLNVVCPFQIYSWSGSTAGEEDGALSSWCGSHQGSVFTVASIVKKQDFTTVFTWESNFREGSTFTPKVVIINSSWGQRRKVDSGDAVLFSLIINNNTIVHIHSGMVQYGSTGS